MYQTEKNCFCLSRLGVLKYYDNFFPLLNVIALPIQRMAHGEDGFYWDNSLELSWQALKLIASLQMTNSTIDKEKTLFLACDASQVAGAYILFQLGNDGDIVMITTCTRVFIRATRNKSAAFRELMSIISGVTDLETIIRSHESEVIILSDSISLSLIARQKFTNNRLLEISIFLSTFSNLTISLAQHSSSQTH